MAEENDDSESSDCCISQSVAEFPQSNNENEYESNDVNTKDPIDESNKDTRLNEQGQQQERRMITPQFVKQLLYTANMDCNFDQTPMIIVPKMDPFWIIIPSSNCFCCKTGFIKSIYFDKQMLTIGGDSHDDVWIWNGAAQLTTEQIVIVKRQ